MRRIEKRRKRKEYRGRAARFHGLQTRALRVNLEGVKKLKMPAVLHWNMDHFLVLCGFSRKGAVLADPAYGMKTVSMEEFSGSFTGIAIELTPSENFQKDREEKERRTMSGTVRERFCPTCFFF